ncbi:MAG: prepilin-type N-terminal cleavage/methylation domain-containing protein [Planctomycetota bacterium]|jgi:prepilin-type N-terminal cleavage/methylation domain-containing protein|nr:prepilin-type N-terminal cleavage/methylation domain-containing protein [Planctomycetota bacterium]
MTMRNRNGFTLLEVMIVMALVSVVFILVGMIMLDAMRASKQEETLLLLDQDASRVFETVNQTLMAGYVPVSTDPLAIGRIGTAAIANLAGNVEQWRAVLRGGSDLIAFLSAIDAEGDGDFFYAGGVGDGRRMIMGIETHEGLREATDRNNAAVGNLGFVDLDPVADFGLSTGGGAITIADQRFASPFVFPAGSGGRNQVYGVIRFAPFRPDGINLVRINEPDIAQDLNWDQDQTDQFVLGHVEIVYPNADGSVVARPLSSASVLLQVNPGGGPGDSLFQLWPQDTGGNNIKMRLTLCNYLEQAQNSWAFGIGGNQYIARTYESLLRMPLMTLQ